MPTKIEWAEETWNPITGCTPISEGCQHCYARRMAYRLRGRFGYPADEPFRVTLHPDRLDEPLRWRKPRRVFVCSMGDLFHEDVSESTLMRVFGTMDLCRKYDDGHTFMVLTKRPERMYQFVSKWWDSPKHPESPLTNVWLGVTVENQKRADERIPILMQIPAAVRFVSMEPLLGPTDAGLFGTVPQSIPYSLGYERLHWIICGAETGPNARPMDLDWARSVRDQCIEAGVPFFYKRGSDGSRLLDGREWNEYPENGAAQ